MFFSNSHFWTHSDLVFFYFFWPGHHCCLLWQATTTSPLPFFPGCQNSHWHSQKAKEKIEMGKSWSDTSISITHQQPFFFYHKRFLWDKVVVVFSKNWNKIPNFVSGQEEDKWIRTAFAPKSHFLPFLSPLKNPPQKECKRERERERERLLPLALKKTFSTLSVPKGVEKEENSHPFPFFLFPRPRFHILILIHPFIFQARAPSRNTINRIAELCL